VACFHRPPRGGIKERNEFAQELLEDILTTPGTRAEVIGAGSKFQGGKYFIAPDGRGVAYDAQGVFRYFGVFKK
jgi:hypothetical protein